MPTCMLSACAWYVLIYLFQFVTNGGYKVLLVDVLKIHINTSFLLEIYLSFLFIPYIKKGKHNGTGIFMEGDSW